MQGYRRSHIRNSARERSGAVVDGAAKPKRERHASAQIERCRHAPSQGRVISRKQNFDATCCQLATDLPVLVVRSLREIDARSASYAAR